MRSSFCTSVVRFFRGLWAVLVLAAVAPVTVVAAAPRVEHAESVGKVDATIREAAALATAGGDAAFEFARQRGLRVRTGTLAAQVVVETATMALGELDLLNAAGAEVTLTSGTSAVAWIPLARLSEVAALPRVLRIRRPVRPTWEVTTEALRSSDADLMHSIGASGQGVRIGVIDEFDGYATRLGGERPPAEKVHLRSFIGGDDGATDHGLSVLEILYDFAPNAEFFLVVIEDDVGYQRAIEYLITQRVDIVNHSGGFGLFGDMRGNGPIHGKIGALTAANILYVTAAGNSGRAHYQANFQDTDGNDFHEFAAGQERLPFTVDDPSLRDIRIDITWDDWLPDPAAPRPTTDYNVCLYDGSGKQLACAKEPQNGGGGQIPYESLEFKVPTVGPYSIGVFRTGGASGLLFELITVPDFDLGPFATPESSIIAPGDHRDALTVGAVNLGGTLRPYSSQGPTNDGRIKPDIVAPDGVITSLGRFYGTSASTPHVAGAAAILKSYEPELGRAGLANRLRTLAVQSTADPEPGLDNRYGEGVLNANFASLVRGPGTIDPPIVKPTGGSGCRLVDPETAAAPLFELLMLAVVLAYAARLRRA